MAVTNVTGVFVAVVLLLALLIRRPLLALVAPASLMVFWSYGSWGVALLWASLLYAGRRREGRTVARYRSDVLVRR
jgi:hypothetical protein